MRRALALTVLTSTLVAAGGTVTAWAAPCDPLWVDRYAGPAPGPDAEDYARDVAVGADGTVYVVGTVASPGTGNDFRTVAYSPGGAVLWSARYDGPAHDFDAAEAVAVAGGVVYVTGTSFSATDADYATIAYDATDGERLWARRYVGPGPAGADRPTAIAADPATGTVSVTGSSGGAGGTLDYATVSYSATGALRWRVRYSVPGAFDDRAAAVAVGADGTTYVTGSSRNTGTGIQSSTTQAYSSVGAVLWSDRAVGPGTVSTTGVDLVVDDARASVIVTGNRSNGDFFDYSTRAFTTGGVPRWTTTYDGTAGLTDEAVGIALNPGTGEVTVTGLSQGPPSFEFATVNYAPGGAQRWVARFDGDENGDFATAVAVDTATGAVYVTGTSASPAGRQQAATVAYSGATGTQQWSSRFGTGAGSVTPGAVAADPATGNVYVVGTVLNAGVTGPDYAAIAYDGR